MTAVTMNANYEVNPVITNVATQTSTKPKEADNDANIVPQTLLDYYSLIPDTPQELIDRGVQLLSDNDYKEIEFLLSLDFIPTQNQVDNIGTAIGNIAKTAGVQRGIIRVPAHMASGIETALWRTGIASFHVVYTELGDVKGVYPPIQF